MAAGVSIMISSHSYSVMAGFCRYELMITLLQRDGPWWPCFVPEAWAGWANRMRNSSQGLSRAGPRDLRLGRCKSAKRGRHHHNTLSSIMLQWTLLQHRRNIRTYRHICTNTFKHIHTRIHSHMYIYIYIYACIIYIYILCICLSTYLRVSVVQARML